MHGQVVTRDLDFGEYGIAMKKSTLVRPNMEGLKINGKHYENLYLQGGACQNAEFVDCVFSDVDFEGVWIVDALFKKCQFDGTLFYDVQGYGVRIQDSAFCKVEFKGCNLAKADFSNCVFNDVVFCGDNIGSVTDISGAYFGDVNLRSVTFRDVEYDAETIFPEGFDPREEAGLTLSAL